MEVNQKQLAGEQMEKKGAKVIEGENLDLLIGSIPLPSDDEKEKEQAEHEKYKKEITKLKLRRLRKETHEAGDVEQFLNNMLIDFRNRLLSVPAKIAPIVIGQTDIHIIISELEKELEMTLEELSNYDPDVINGTEPIDYDVETDEEE